jgi:hypothetical protein
MAGHEGAEGKAGDRQRRIGRRLLLDGGQHVLQLAAAFVVGALAGAHAAKLKRSARQPHSTQARARVCTTLLSWCRRTAGGGGR